MKKGFTLLELLIVIGILAILATIVALVLNPAELLRQARDSQRLSDLRTLNSAIGLWVASATSTTFITTAAQCTNGTSAPGPTTTVCDTNASTKINGTGWVPVDFTAIPGGSPLSRLPLDPLNTSTSSAYIFKGDNTNVTFEINANMESARYKSTGANDVESNNKDGGNNNDWYEIGTDPDLDLI